MSSSSWYYSLYGLRVCADQPVFEFEPARPAAEPVDVRIRWQEPRPTPDYGGQGHCFTLEQHQATLCFQGVGVFRLPDQATILVEPEPGADGRMVARYLSGVVFAVLLHLRGLVVCHAGSVAVENQEAIVFIGESGAGKSTLAALLHLRGYSCIADDVTAIRVDTHRIDTMPGFPLVKIDPDLARHHRIPVEDLLPVHNDEEQVYLHLHRQLPATPLTLRAMVFLDVAPRMSLQRISARQAMMATVRYTLPTRLLHRTGSGDHFHRCAKIAASVPAYTLSRTNDRDARERLADMVVNELMGAAVASGSKAMGI